MMLVFAKCMGGVVMSLLLQFYLIFFSFFFAIRGAGRINRVGEFVFVLLVILFATEKEVES